MSRRALPLYAVLLASCVPRATKPYGPVDPPHPPPPAQTAPPEPGTLVAPAPPVAADAGPEADAPARADAGTAADATGDGAPTARSSGPIVHVEKPYKLYQRPRADGTVYAAGRDDILARWNVGGTGDPAFISNHAGYHPWPRVRVDTKILGGHLPKRAPYDRRTGHRRHVLSIARVQAEARAKGYWAFRLCSEAGLRRDQKMHGQTILRFSITTRGHVVHGWVVKSKLGDAEVKSCLRTALHKLEFKPAPRRRVDVELSVKLWPGDAPVPLIGPPDPDKAPENPGQLDVPAIEKATTDVPHSVGVCYRAALERDPHLWGRIQLDVELDEKGRVRHVAENESHFPDQSVVRCAIQALRKSRFHAAKGGALSFVYALRLGGLAPLPSTTAENQ